ncbi:MAG: hypothetical protein HGJ94_14600 [Desulfosarcina sp.]|nr:hypothetical protein [Desulfosarcina sp.]MBC2742999.1 hypothetical protein [Desulfosarcina sp.]MBC2765909.1 hypothetical protein [Desulfosarcina sp.]
MKPGDCVLWLCFTLKDLTVFISASKASCDDCGENLGRGAWITLAGEKGVLCLSCADLDHLKTGLVAQIESKTNGSYIRISDAPVF